MINQGFDFISNLKDLYETLKSCLQFFDLLPMMILKVSSEVDNNKKNKKKANRNSKGRKKKHCKSKRIKTL